MTALQAVTEQPTVEPTVKIETITPAVAKHWLARNVRNRSIRTAVVEAYARDMRAGNWRLTGEAIKFDTNGALSDGQHRLAAIKSSGCTVQMMVVRGIEPDAQAVMDTGAKRSASDALTLNHVKNSSIVAATARFALREPSAGFIGHDERVSNPTHTEIAAFIEENPQIHRAADATHRFYPAFDCPPSVLALCWMRPAEINLPDCALFFEGVANMTTDGPGDPRHALIRRLSNARRTKEQLSQTAYLSLVFRAWNAWRRGTSLNKLQTEARGHAVKVPERLR